MRAVDRIAQTPYFNKYPKWGIKEFTTLLASHSHYEMKTPNDLFIFKTGQS